MFNLSTLNKKALYTLTITFLIILTISFFNFSKAISTKSKISLLHEQVNLSINISLLTHELQIERGLSTGFINSNDKEFSQALKSQIKISDITLSNLKKFINNKKKHDPELDKILDHALKKLDKIYITREAIENLSIDESEIISYYSEINDNLFNTIIYVSKNSHISEITNMLISYINLLYFEETSGIERALVTAVLTKNQLDKLTRDTLISMIHSQNIHLDYFFKYACDSSKEVMNVVLEDEKMSKVKKLRDTLLYSDKTSDYDIDAKEWFDVITDKINLMQDVDNYLVNKILLKIDSIYDENTNLSYIYIFVGVLLLLLAISAFLFYMSRESKYIVSLKKNNDKLQYMVEQKTKNLQMQKHELEVLLSSFNKNVIFSKTDLNGIITHASEAFCQISGYSHDELIGKGHNILRHEEMESDVFEDMWKTIKGDACWFGEVKNRKKDGSFYWVLSRISPDYNYEGKHIGYYAVRHDITDKKALEDLSHKLEYQIAKRTRKLQEEKQNYEALFLSSIDGIIIMQDGEFIKANDVIWKMLNYDSLEEFMSVDKSALYPEYQPNGQRSVDKLEEMKKICLKHGSHRFECVHTKKTGENFWCDISFTKVNFNNIESIQIIWRDSSRQKELEEHLEDEVRQRTKELEIATRTKSDFLANMSHEIRTPLNAIMGFVDILHKNETQEDKQKKLKIIKDSGSSLLTIINDILDFSKIESKKLLVEKVPFNIEEAFNQTTQLFFEKAQERNVTIELSIDEKLPRMTLGDIVRVKQVLSNFISNAIKFAKENSIVHVKVNLLEEDKLICRVIDNGIGISPDKIDTIFDSFTQEDTSTTRKYGGTGLGLTISKALVNLMDGEIGVNSKLDVGSSFYFTIPLFKVNEEMLNDEDIEELLKNKKILKGKVLIVEDNKANQMLMSLLLEEHGLKFKVANDGLEAVEMIQKEKFNLVLMDENMPNMNGIEATKIIKKIDKIKDIPVIAVTANALKGDKEKFIECGMDDYLSKPIDSEKLEAMLRKYL